MGRQIIEIVQVLVDRIEKNGYQQRAREENAFDLNKRLTEAEGWVAHWKQARQEAHEAGELMKAEIETLRKELADAQRAVSDEFTERQVLEANGLGTLGQQFQRAVSDAFSGVNSLRQQLKAVRAEIETLKGAMAADDKRLRDAEERIWPERTLGCDAPDAMADEILHLRQQLDAANAAVSLQRAGIERLHKFVGTVRLAMWPEDIKSALTKLDAGAEPTAVAEPARCPECVKLRTFVEKIRDASWNTLRATAGSALAELDAGTQPAPVAEPTPCPECERLRAELETANEHRTDLLLFVDKVRKSFRVWGGDQSFFDSVSHALDQLDAGTIKPTPVAERCPECDGSGMVDSGGFGPDGKAISVPCGGDCRGNPCPSQPTPVAEPLDAEGGA